MRGMTEETVTELPKGSAWVQKAVKDTSISAQTRRLPDARDVQGKLDLMPQDKPFAGESQSKTYKGDALPWIDLKQGGIKMVTLTGEMKERRLRCVVLFSCRASDEPTRASASFTGALISGVPHRGQVPTS